MVEIEEFNKNKKYDFLEKIDLIEKEFENCEFSNCDFIGGSLSNSLFINCVFKECTLKNVEIKKTKFQSVKFDSCTLMGIDFENIDKFLIGLDFFNSKIVQTNFSRISLKKTKFIHCQIIDCDFEETILEKAEFNESVFRSVLFKKTNLEEANFLGAKGFLINPTDNKIKGAKFDLMQANGLLRDFGIKLFP